MGLDETIENVNGRTWDTKMDDERKAVVEVDRKKDDEVDRVVEDDFLDHFLD